jgi:hypothetical protein
MRKTSRVGSLLRVFLPIVASILLGVGIALFAPLLATKAFCVLFWLGLGCYSAFFWLARYEGF